MKHLYFLLLIGVLFSSCKDEFPALCGNHIEDSEKLSSKKQITDEQLYLQQTDKQIMLISMVRFDNDQGKYILDLSVEDAEYLGIDEKYYVEVKNMVEKMNE